MVCYGSPYRYLTGSFSLSPHTYNPPQRFMSNAGGVLFRPGAYECAYDIHELPFSCQQPDAGYSFIV